MFKFTIISILLLIFVISCKKTTNKGSDTIKNTPTNSISQNQNLLTLFIQSTSFDFNGENKEKVNTLIG